MNMKNKPNSKCPFYEDYKKDSDEEFCEPNVCMYLHRCSSEDCRKGLAWICAHKSMEPDIYYQECEPGMPWE